MTISRINLNNTTTEKVRLLNNMIMELNGKIEQAKFDINEIAQIFSDLGIDRQYSRNVSLGHLTGDYTDWTHVKEETGYSIWKIAPSNYSYNANNQLYLDGELVEAMGQTSAESATTFDAVYLYDDSAYTDNTTEAGTEVGTAFSLMDETTDYLYIGEATKFGGIKFEFSTRGSGYSNVVEYYNGSAWTPLGASGDNLEDNTSDFESDGLIKFDQPADWDFTTVNGAYKYWIRIYSTSTPVTTATAFYVIPGNTVPGILALSSSEIINGEWKWCSYNSNVYVTIRNAGNSAYEGNYYITSASTATNLQNYFIYNHHYQLDHVDSTYAWAGMRMQAGTGTEVLDAVGQIETNLTQAGTDAGIDEDTIWSYTLPANTLATNGDAVRVTAWGTYASNGNNKTLKFKYDSATHLTTGVQTYNGVAWRIDAIIARVGASSQDLNVMLNVSAQSPNVQFGTDAADLTGDTVIAITGENGSAVADEITFEGAIVEYVPYKV
jgi:hypothetical protein